MDPLTPLVIARDDPARPEVAQVIATHLNRMQAVTPPESVFALPLDRLRAPDILFFSLSSGGIVAGIGALRLLGDGTGELKSMHTLAAHRGRGFGAAMVAHLIEVARGQGLQSLYLETGPGEGHADARRLYARMGFTQCGPFADYRPDPHSFFMHLALS